MSHVAIKEYHEKRTPADFDLISHVRGLLISNNVSPEGMNAFNNNNYVIEGADRKPEVQRYLMNRYWNLQLMSAAKVSINERYCLIPNGSIEDWCRLFSDKVLPFALHNGLPK